MMQFIVYQNDEGRMAVVMPTQEALEKFGIAAIAEKDVPFGKPFKIVDASEVPENRTDRDSWVVDVSELTDGAGSKSNRFDFL